MKSETGKLPPARRDDVFFEQIGDELLVYDARHHRAHRLNSMAAWVWHQCDGEKTIAQTTRLLSDQLQQPLDEELVWLSLETLDKSQLLDTPLQRPIGANEDSRRAMIQKMMAAGGLMLLLPVITPLTKAARADAPVIVKNDAGPAVQGLSKGTGVYGESSTWMGVVGKSTSPTGGAGVRGEAIGPGVVGDSQTWYGVYGETKSTTGGAGVGGVHTGAGVGAWGQSKSGVGVLATSDTGTAFQAESKNGGRAGFFKGNVDVTGDIRLVNADCAEDFDIVDADSVEAGTVMVLCDEGALQCSATAYDKRVAGVISGAGDYKPGLILDKRPTGRPRLPVALMGKVFCKADARYGAIVAGDLLTTSDTPGHVMKASDSAQAFGAVVGKALSALPAGQALIPILVSLQ